MNFTSKSAEQIKADKLIKDGVYPFRVMSAKNKASKKEQARAAQAGRQPNEDMIELELNVYVNDKPRKQRDWLGSWAGGEEKILQFCDATGQADKYGNGSLEADDCAGCDGYVLIGHKDHPQYGPQNTIRAYVRAEDAEALHAKITKGAGEPLAKLDSLEVPSSGSDDDDSVPF